VLHNGLVAVVGTCEGGKNSEIEIVYANHVKESVEIMAVTVVIYL